MQSLNKFPCQTRDKVRKGSPTDTQLGFALHSEKLVCEVISRWGRHAIFVH